MQNGQCGPLITFSPLGYFFQLNDVIFVSSSHLQIEGSSLPSPLDAIYTTHPLALVHLHDTGLLSLDLSGLSLPCIPPQISRLTTLQALNLANNRIEELSPELGRLTQLTALDLRGNPLQPHLTNIAEALDDLALVKLCDVRGDKLDLSYCFLSSVPEEIRWHSQSLTQLKLPHNEITSLPEWIDEMKVLGTVVMDSNLLEQVPQALLTLPKLVILMISDNKIVSLPDNIDVAQRLQALMLPGNSIPSLPPSIGKLADLKAISLASNALTTIPEEIGNCSSLRLLDFSNNEIEVIPDSIGSLQKLKALKMANNKLAKIPAGLADLQTLADVSFSGNPFVYQAQSDGAPTMALDATNNFEESARIVTFLVQMTSPAPPPLSSDAPSTHPSVRRSEESLITQDAFESQVNALKEDVVPRSVPQTPRDNIRTVAGDAMRHEIDERVSRAREKDAADEEAHKWLYLKKHHELVARDTVRLEHASKGLESISLMQVPTIFSVISNPPTNPTQPSNRPQSLYKYKRLADQGNAVTQLIDRVNIALEKN